LLLVLLLKNGRQQQLQQPSCSAKGLPLHYCCPALHLTLHLLLQLVKYQLAVAPHVHLRHG
jgi:hypothetical protein